MNNYSPSLWGQSAWKFLFYCAMAYPNNPNYEDMYHMNNFLLNLGHILPCETCRMNYYEHLNIYPLNDEVLQNRQNLINWLINIHNQIYQQNGKNPLSYNDIMNKYINENNNASNANEILSNGTSSIIIAILIIIIIIIGYIYFTKVL